MVLHQGFPTRGRDSRRCLLSGILPAAIVAAPFACERLLAADVVNTASLALPAGIEDADLSNNSAIDSDGVVVPLTATDDGAEGIDSAKGSERALNVLDNDRLGAAAIGADSVSLSVVTPASSIGDGPVPVLDPVSGEVRVPAGTPAGTYTIVYQICEGANPANCAQATVTIGVEPARGGISGTVFLDMNANHTLDPGDERKAGWIVEVVRDGEVVASVISGEDGSYLIEGLLVAEGYEVVFRNPENNVVYGRITDLAIGEETIVIDQDLPIDPAGVVYDAITRQPVAGARVSLADASGLALPVSCFFDPSQQHQITPSSGDYRFDIVPGGATSCPREETTYTITIVPPAGYAFVSTVLLPETGPLDSTGLADPYMVLPTLLAPQGAETRYFLSFRLATGDPQVIANHIPLDPFLTRTPLVATKTSTKRTVSTGDLVPYEITVRNTESAQRAGVNVIDILPPGMKYIAGSGAVNGLASEPEAAAGGRQLVWRDQIIPANGSQRYTLTLIVGAGVSTGLRVNTGLAQSGSDNSVISNRAEASVAIIPSSVFDCSELLGKVFEDTNRNGYQDAGEPGIAAARVATVNGQLVTTDAKGRYHIACVAVPDARIGSNFVLKLDMRSIPLGWEATTANPQVLRMTRGKAGEINFGVAPRDFAKGGK